MHYRGEDSECSHGSAPSSPRGTLREAVRGNRGRTASSHDLSGALADVAALIALATAIAFVLGWSPAWPAGGAEAALGTAIALIVLLTTGLVAIEYRRRGQLELLLLVGGLIAVGLTDFGFWIPRIVAGVHDAQPGADAHLLRSAVLPLTLVVAALARGHVPVRNPRAILIVACIAGLAAIAVAEGVDVLVGRPASAAPRAEVLIVNLAVASAFVVTAAVLWWRSRPPTSSDSLLAGAAVLLAAAHLQAPARSSLPVTWVTAADLLELGAYVLLLAAAVAEYRWMRRADDLASRDSQREEFVRDLHDGLVQDLAALAMHSEQLDETQFADPALLGDAARRALAASRRTIVDLSASTPPNSVTSLVRLSSELQARLGLEIEVHTTDGSDICPAFDLEPAAHRRFVRVARDTIVGTARRFPDRRLDVDLQGCGTRWRLTVRCVEGERERVGPR